MDSIVGEPIVSRTTASAQERAGKYLTFHLGCEAFAIQVLRVREIIAVQDITAVPQTPGHVRGVINLRGKVIPVIDLRHKFGLPEVQYTQHTCIIVVEVLSEGGSLLVGTIVDAVSEVVNIVADDIEDAPDFGDGVETPYLLGMAKLKGKVKILLDINQVLTTPDLQGTRTDIS